MYKTAENTEHSSLKMELGNSDDRVYAAERILKKRVKKVRGKKWKNVKINIKTTTKSLV